MGKRALELLQEIYQNEMAPLQVRMRAAIECLPFEAPKVSSVALAHLRAEEFAARLDRASEASNRAKLIEGRAIEVDERR